MGLKFTVVASIFQILLIVLFSVLVDYSNHALPPHILKDATGAAQNTSDTISNNDITVYYPSKREFLLFFN